MVQLRRYWDNVFPYHLTTATINREKLFLDHDRATFIVEFLLEARRRDDIMLLACCVMPDHLHICLVPRRKDPSVFMMGLKTMSASKFKRGRIWRRRFWDKKIESERELRDTVDYIHNNPVKDGIVLNAETYKYSSISSWESLDLHILLECGPEV